MKVYPLSDIQAFIAARIGFNVNCLIAQYAAFFILLSFDFFSKVDFMFTLFITSTPCFYLGWFASNIQSNSYTKHTFLQVFIYLQGVAIMNYFGMGMSYLFGGDNFSTLIAGQLELNGALIACDIIILAVVAYGSRRVSAI